MLNKDNLRKKLRLERKNISPIFRKEAAVAAASLLHNNALFQRSDHIAVYSAQQEEFETLPIIKAIWQNKKNCYLPLIHIEKNLGFALFNENDRLRPNRFHIFESENTSQILASQLNLVILPLVGFDLNGHRLGLGGGYYDRTFAFKLNSLRAQPFLLGLGFEAQCLLECPVNQDDVSLDGILTEKRIIIFEEKKIPHAE